MQAETRLCPLKYVAVKEANNLIIRLQMGHHHALQNIQKIAERAAQSPLQSKENLLVKTYQKWVDSGIRIRQTTTLAFSPPQLQR
jgi:hypothetical protein